MTAPADTPTMAHDRLRRLFAAAHAGPAVVTIGTFDGVHAGHRALVARARQEAGARNARLVAITFTPRPDVLIRGRRALPDICSIEERIARLRAAGADDVVVVPFDRQLMTVTAAEFVAHLTSDLGMVALCVGSEFALGRGREGTVAALRELGVDVVAVAVEHLPGRREKISSSRIRSTMSVGVPEALAMTCAPPVAGDMTPLSEFSSALEQVATALAPAFTLGMV